MLDIKVGLIFIFGPIITRYESFVISHNDSEILQVAQQANLIEISFRQMN